MFDAFDTLEAIFWQQERDAKKVQSKDVSLKRMALKRILIRNKLQSMHAEIKHQMIYESPEELGSLWSDFEAMRNTIEAEQKTAREIQEHEDELELKRKDALMREARDMSIDAGVAFAALLFLGWIMWQIKVQTAARASFWVT
jgi:predicted transcriptional regulator